NLSTGLRKTTYESIADRIAQRGRDDGDRDICLPSCKGCRSSTKYDDEIHSQTDQCGEQLGEPLHPSERRTGFEDQVVSWDVAKLAHTLKERASKAADLWVLEREG